MVDLVVRTEQAYEVFMARLRDSQATVLEEWRQIVEEAARKERSND